MKNLKLPLMRDTLQILRNGGLEGLEANSGRSYIEKVVDGACMELGINLEPKVRAWLSRTLMEAFRADDKGLSVISRTDSVRDMVRRALSSGNILGLVETGKKCLLAAGGFAETKKFTTTRDYLRTSEATLRKAGQVAPFLDEIDDLPNPMPGLVVPSDEVDWRKEILRLNRPPKKEPMLELAASNVGPMAEVIRLIYHLCINGDLIAAIQMAPGRALQGSDGLIY